MITEGWKQNSKSQEKLSKEYDVGFERYCNWMARKLYGNERKKIKNRMTNQINK